MIGEILLLYYTGCLAICVFIVSTTDILDIIINDIKAPSCIKVLSSIELCDFNKINDNVFEFI